MVCWNFSGMQITRRCKRRFDEAVRSVTPCLGKSIFREKEAPVCLLALSNANRKLAEVNKSAAS